MGKWIKVLIVMILMFVIAGGASLAAQTTATSVEKTEAGYLSFKLKDADIKSVLQIFAKQLGINIVAGDDVKGTVSLSFTKVRPREGLEAVLRAKGLDWFQEGDTLIVTTDKAVRTYILEYANAEEVQKTLDLLAGPGDVISVNASYNALVVKTSTDNIGRIEKAIREMDVPPLQVVVEAKIIEIKLGDVGNLGLDVKYENPRDVNDIAQTKNLAGRPTDTGAFGFYAQAISNNVEAYLSTLQTLVGYNLITAPRVTTLNHKEASILIGSKLGYKTAVITDTGTVQQINYLTTGTSLKFTPHVSESGFIRMLIEPKISEGYISEGDVPNENTTETKNEVLVKDGQTIVIGGLYKNSETQTDKGVPILMHIPLLGGLFRKSEVLNEKRELLIFITPHIMTPEYLQKLADESKEFEKREREQRSTIIH